jgi:predicted nucleotidyltransferase
MSSENDEPEPVKIEKTSLDAESAAYAAEVARRLQTVLADNLVGVYLHGSAVLGDFARDQSDIDVIAVSKQSLSVEQKQALAHQLSSTSLPVPVRELEFHLIARDSISDDTHAPPYELHFVGAKSGGDRVIDGQRRPGDPDLVMHFAVLSKHGRALLGPPASEVFPRPGRETLTQAFVGELNWAKEHASPTYQVLNAARAWQFLETGAIVSKLDGGAWARGRVRDSATIEAALAHRRGVTDAEPTPELARAFVDDVLIRLEQNARGT